MNEIIIDEKEEMQGIPHHLVDCYKFDEEYHVKLFQEKARAAIDDITSRGKLPIICGGTGLYIKSVLYDYQFSEDKEDDEFIQFLNTRSKDELYGLLQVIDPKSCEKIHKNNTKRVIRCLCIAHSGEKKSDSEEKQKHEMIYDAYIIGLTLPREQLYQRINDRVDMMMDEGLFEEIKYLTTLKENVWDLQSTGLTFRSLIHFEFIFVYGVRKCSSFILLQVEIPQKTGNRTAI